MTASSGTMSVIPISDDDALFDGSAHDLTDLYSTQGAQIGKMREFQYNLSPMEDEYTFFKPTSNNITVTGNDQDFTSVLVVIDGSANTLYMAWEVVIHYEGIVTATSGSALGTLSNNNPNNSLIKTYQTRMARLYSGFKSGPTELVHRTLERVAKRAAITLGRSAVNYLLPGAGPMLQLTNIPDVD
jgi:hypothetical protein